MAHYVDDANRENTTLGCGVRFATRDDAERARRDAAAWLDCADWPICESPEAANVTYADWAAEPWPG